MERYWLLSSTTYGNWLPGDSRGFVSGVDDIDGSRIVHNQPKTEYDRDMPGLREFAQGEMKGPPITFNIQQAEAIFLQFHETSFYRKWELRAIGIMGKHVHLVVGVNGDPDPYKVLGDFKSYASRVLSKKWGKPESDTWWTEKGSARKLRDEAAIFAAIEYVRNQERPLLIWIAGEDPAPVIDVRRGTL